MNTPAEKPSKFRPEAPKRAFSVEMRYNPDFLFYVLTHDNHWQEITLDNNMREITESGYDVFRSAHIVLTSNLKVKTQPDWPDRSTKTLSIRADLWNLEQHKFFQEEKIPAIMEAVYAQGIDTDLKSPPYHKGLVVQPIHSRVLMVKDANPPWALEICPFGGVEIIYPYPEQLIDLHSSADIQKALSPIPGIMEKVMRAFYQMENKHLPMEKLVFTPDVSEEEKAKKYFSSCTYCHQDYSLINGPKCPNCGASKPKFGISE